MLIEYKRNISEKKEGLKKLRDTINIKVVLYLHNEMKYKYFPAI